MKRSLRLFMCGWSDRGRRSNSAVSRGNPLGGIQGTFDDDEVDTDIGAVGWSLLDDDTDTSGLFIRGPRKSEIRRSLGRGPMARDKRLPVHCVARKASAFRASLALPVSRTNRPQSRHTSLLLPTIWGRGLCFRTTAQNEGIWLPSALPWFCIPRLP